MIENDKCAGTGPLVYLSDVVSELVGQTEPLAFLTNGQALCGAPVAAWSHSGDWTDDPDEADFWKADPMRRGIVEYVIRTEAAMAIFTAFKAGWEAGKRDSQPKEEA